MAVCIASSKVSSHRHALPPHTRPPCAMCAHGVINLTSKLAKHCLHVRGPGGIRGAAWRQTGTRRGGRAVRERMAPVVVVESAGSAGSAMAGVAGVAVAGAGAGEARRVLIDCQF
jgi:hypothetical protein